ncbi:ankyrin repeat domain-containing protein [Acrocarpospora sp. B8E8]|uniref:ankyrin repeat domain-containing protein n=1 Tax=Acrocarpospora sp. B8E8 TaxID=3153572 RepID=UPI00325C8E90
MSVSFPPDEAAVWQRVRRYAVPRWMIEQATERRLAGDWRGACAAANVDVAFDLAEIAAEYGPAITATLAEDLHHLAPDLLRWHLPRNGHTTVGIGQQVILSRENAVLRLTTPRMSEGPQRLVLRFGPAPAEEPNRVDWSAARHLWDVRHAADLRERCGGGHRTPFFNADGSPADLPTADPGRSDPAAHMEWVTSLHDRGEFEAALTAAGLALEIDLPERRFSTHLPRQLVRLPLALTRLEPEARRLAEQGAGHLFRIGASPYVVLLEPGKAWVRVVRDRGKRSVELPGAFWRRLPDLDLLRFGRLAPEHLHPLVRDALFPEHPAVTSGPPGPELPSPVRVRCRGEWHEVCSGEGTLRMPHREEEQRRERAMRALGGAVTGCFAVQHSWTSGIGRLPKALRDQRRELFLRVQHGDTPGVLRLLDAGVDPHVRNGRQRTLLHMLHLLDHEELLPRLLAAGLDVEAKDQHQRTPLHVAVGDGGSAALVRGLRAAGARIDVIDVIDVEGWSLADLIRRRERADLGSLLEELDRDYPGIGLGA